MLCIFVSFLLKCELYSPLTQSKFFNEWQIRFICWHCCYSMQTSNITTLNCQPLWNCRTIFLCVVKLWIPIIRCISYYTIDLFVCNIYSYHHYYVCETVIFVYFLWYDIGPPLIQIELKCWKMSNKKITKKYKYNVWFSLYGGWTWT